MKEIQRWADQAMFKSAPVPDENRDDHGNIVPRVHLLWMTPDPLGAIAAMGRMYKGIPTHHMSEITDDERRQFFHDAQATHLRAPLEAVKFHFFIEGVTRSNTHQMVRQRTAVYAQESLRFAVKEDLANECSIPPSIAELDEDDQRRVVWNATLGHIAEGYNFRVDNSIPAEDARGLMPHAITTRLNYVTDLRNMSDHAGNRLCTQAQFEWRIVFTEIVKAIRDYAKGFMFQGQDMNWQFRELADSGLFRPVCYQLGHCPFNASFDRGCKIKSRVEEYAERGIHSNFWGDPENGPNLGINHINTAEWLLDHTSARYGKSGHE